MKNNPVFGSKRWLPWLITGGLLLIVGILGVKFLAHGDKTNCPKFKSAGLKILIIPFKSLADSKQHPALSIQSRIRELTAANQLATSVEVINDPKYEKTNPDISEAIELSAHCQADMVIWGQYEPLEDNAISVDLNYAFTQTDWPPGYAIQLFKNVNEINSAKEVKLTELDDAIFRICMALALREDRLELAERWLNKIKNPNQREMEWRKQLVDR